MSKSMDNLDRLFGELCDAEPIADSTCWGDNCSAKVPSSSRTGLCEPCIEARRDDSHTAPEPKLIDTARPIGPAWGGALAALYQKARRLFPSGVLAHNSEGRIFLQEHHQLRDITDEVLAFREGPYGIEPGEAA